jgi:hypothetical protein
MVLRTAASTSIHRDHRLQHRHTEDVFVQRLVGQALELPVHGLLAHQVNDQLEAHLAAHRGLAEDGLDVEQPDAAHLEQVHQELRAAALERGLRHAVEVDRVVGHQAVAARDQLEAQFALAQTRLACEQHTHAEDVHEHPVPGGALREVLSEVAPHHVDHVARRLGRGEQRDVGAITHRHQLVGRDLGVGDDQHRRLERHDAGDAALGHLGSGLVEVGHLTAADDLHAIGVDVVQVADQVGCRLRIAHRSFVEPALRMGVARDPFPLQGGAVLFEQRFRADDAGFHAERATMRVMPRTSAVPSWR